MKRNLIIALIVLVACLFVNYVTQAQAKEQTIKYGAGYVIQDDYSDASSVAAKALMNEIETRTNGQISVKFYGGGQLGKEKQLLVQTRQGLIQLTDTADGHFTPLYPNIQVFGIPYLFVDRQIAWHMIRGKTARALQEDMAKTVGLRPIVFKENGGFRNFTNNKRPLRTPDDLKGLKIRTMQSPMHMQIVKDLGASPTPIPFLELYSALQMGVADGQENAVPTFRYPKLEEVQKYMILDGHVFSIRAFLVCEKWYQSLPKDQQIAIQQAAEMAARVNDGVSYVEEKRDIVQLREMGLDIYDPPLEVKNEFRNLTQKSAIEWLKSQKNVDPKYIDMILEETKQVEKELGYVH